MAEETPQTETSLFVELTQFLTHANKNVRDQALAGLLAYSQNPVFLTFCATEKAAVVMIRHLLAAACSAGQRRSDALQLLVNLSQIRKMGEVIIKFQGINKLMESYQPLSPVLSLMLLTNLTRLGEGRRQFLQIGSNYASAFADYVDEEEGGGKPPAKRTDALSAADAHKAEATEFLPLMQSKRGAIHALYFMRIITGFTMTVGPSDDGEHPDRYLWVSHILCNLTGDAPGRAMIVAQGPSLLNEIGKALLVSGRQPQILQTLKHLMSDSSLRSHLGVLEDESSNASDGSGNKLEVLVVPYLCCLVYPPKGPSRLLKVDPNEALGHTTPHDKIEEAQQECQALDEPRKIHPIVDEESIGLIPEQHLRATVLEILGTLLSSESGREKARQFEVYEVFRLWHLLETDDEIQSGIEEIVHLVHYSEEELREQDAENSCLPVPM